MDATTFAAFLASLGDGLMFTPDAVAFGYVEGRGNERRFDGVRPSLCPLCGHPGPVGIWIHGYTPIWKVTWRNRGFWRFKLWKRRFLCRTCSDTWHLRPHDELPGISCCTLVFVMFVWAVAVFGLNGAYRALPWDACDHAEVGTLRRWYRRACAAAEATEACIRRVVGDRSEPGSAKSAFPTGLSPPASSRRSCPRLAQAGQLRRCLAVALNIHQIGRVPYTQTLAQARLVANELNTRFLA